MSICWPRGVVCDWSFVSNPGYHMSRVCATVLRVHIALFGLTRIRFAVGKWRNQIATASGAEQRHLPLLTNATITWRNRRWQRGASLDVCLRHYARQAGRLASQSCGQNTNHVRHAYEAAAHVILRNAVNKFVWWLRGVDKKTLCSQPAKILRSVRHSVSRFHVYLLSDRWWNSNSLYNLLCSFLQLNIEIVTVKQSSLSLFSFLKFGFMCVYASIFICCF